LAARRRALERSEVEVIAVRDAAELLGVSMSTMKRRVLASVERRKTPRGGRGIARHDLLALMSEPWPQKGRPISVSREIRGRILNDRRRGASLRTIAAELTADGVPTARGGQRWWASTVRSVLESDHGVGKPTRGS
jgi:transposase